MEKEIRENEFLFLYSKIGKDKRYKAMDMSEGVQVDKLIYATYFYEEKLDRLKEILSNVKVLEDTSFQVRNSKGKVFYECFVKSVKK